MIQRLSKSLTFNIQSIENTVHLLDDGATIPFIARYRKEATNNLDEVQISAIRDAYNLIKELDKRRDFIIESIDSHGFLTDEIKNKLIDCNSISEIEDIYLPFKPQRNTKATIARKKGLEPLAKIIMAQNNSEIRNIAERFVGKDKADNVDDAIDGAGYIVAEWINENVVVRKKLRLIFQSHAFMKSKKISTAKDEQETYKNYYQREESISKATSHKILAVLRGEKEGILRVSFQPEKKIALDFLERYFIKPDSKTRELMSKFIDDSYKRLLSSSLENELRNELKEKADKKAIEVFGKNLEQLLMLPPLPNKRILAIDPGFRSGCKLVCLDENGNLLHNETIYPHPPQKETAYAMKKISSLVQQFKTEAIAIGNGTAGRETEDFIKRIRFNSDVIAMMVNENGASVYSASNIARQEFPEYDITVRGAVSIGRRLADPLAELVKIDPKSIGVGQYQHDVDQKALKQSLDDVVISCVNRVGVDINTASKELLQYVSGLSSSIAENIVNYRKENGNFNNRQELMHVPRLGAKAFEQAAGFIKIRNAKNPLDDTSVHPEAYSMVAKMAKNSGVSISEIIRNNELLDKLNIEEYVNNKFGDFTIKDIIAELKKPNRDPRKKVANFEFSKIARSINDLEIGMKLPGIITNITGFGAFVDLGIHQDGLIHISQLSDSFVSDPQDIVHLNQYVEVEVIKLEILQKRINLKLLK
ncbi:MAG: RNA-binding transcriptional accessory protein [Bacteroidetes bacterium CG2_30_33_31]|nr:MAG: RNA-binding transcriptional accessory protein [Bacteroidetes bacterium CG2_30_33_31]